VSGSAPDEVQRTASLLRWLRDCLAEERSGRGIANIFAASVKSRHFVVGEDRATGVPSWLVDLPPSQAREIADRADLYRRECGLHYATLFLTGNAGGRDLAAPVLLFPVEDSRPQGSTFAIDSREWRFNPVLIELLGLTDAWESEWVPRVNALLDSGGAVSMAIDALRQAFPEIDATAASGPLAKAAALKASAAEPGLKLHAAAVIILAERSPNVRGVLDEISRINKPGPVLQALFGGASPPPMAAKKKAECQPENVPAVLSTAQEALVRDAARSRITVCHGPPGTGKTFTLAAAAIEHAVRAQGVLVICRSTKAADVMERTIDRIVGNDTLTLRTGKKKAVMKLRDQIDLLLSRAYADPKSTRSRRNLDRTRAELAAATRSFESQLDAAITTGKWFDPEGEPRWWHPLGQWWGKAGSSSPLLMEMADRLQELQQQRLREAKRNITESHALRIDGLMREKPIRDSLRLYRNALKRRSSGAWERDLADVRFDLLLAIFPIWIVESDDVHRVLPLAAGLFPLVIIDESSQCDLASAIPAIHRGDRVLIAGDPKQLRHVSFLADARLTALGERHGISRADRERFHFRQVSLIDAALEVTDSVHFLAEHFRSRPELIAFSNATFYRNRLSLMRELPAEPGASPAAELHRVSGSRDGRGVNERELEAVAAYLRRRIEGRPRSGSNASIGFLSPFRAQVDAFASAMIRHLGQELLSLLVNDHALVAATAHGFQGDERDLMIVSLALSDECPAATRRFLEREDVFNVSITRARDHMVVFHSVDRAALPEDSLLRNWLRSLEKTHRLPVDDPACRWVDEVALRLRAHGLTCGTGLSVGGIPVDLLVKDTTTNRSLAIDLVGQRGPAGERVSLRDQLLLRRSGLKLIPLGIHEWRSDPERCMEGILIRFAPIKTAVLE
jgi:hypothetical protein